MRVLIISDIHANLTAFKTVLSPMPGENGIMSGVWGMLSVMVPTRMNVWSCYKQCHISAWQVIMTGQHWGV